MFMRKKIHNLTPKCNIFYTSEVMMNIIGKTVLPEWGNFDKDSFLVFRNFYLNIVKAWIPFLILLLLVLLPVLEEN